MDGRLKPPNSNHSVRFSAIPADLSKLEPANSDPARPHYGPKDFAWTLRALSGVLKASSGAAGPRFGASSDRIREEGLTP